MIPPSFSGSGSVTVMSTTRGSTFVPRITDPNVTPGGFRVTGLQTFALTVSRTTPLDAFDSTSAVLAMSPMKRAVSSLSSKEPVPPGGTVCCAPWTVVQPQLVFTSLMTSGSLPVLVKVTGFTAVSPRLTIPKSAVSESKAIVAFVGTTGGAGGGVEAMVAAGADGVPSSMAASVSARGEPERRRSRIMSCGRVAAPASLRLSARSSSPWRMVSCTQAACGQASS